MSAIVGVAGLEATYEAILAGKRIGLANKEVLVASGELVVELPLGPPDTELLPVDSEHNGASSVLAGWSTKRSHAPHPDRLGRAVPRNAARGASIGNSRSGVEASYLENGPAHYNRLRHHDEQRF